MKKLVAIIAMVVALGGCTMTNVDLDKEEVTTEKADTSAFKKHKPIKGIVIIPTITTNS